MDEKDKVIGKILTSDLTFDNPDDAWEHYIKLYTDFCTWTRGYKYWRKEPELHDRMDLETKKVEYMVGSRMTLSMEEIPEDTLREHNVKPANFTYNGIGYNWQDYSK